MKKIACILLMFTASAFAEIQPEPLGVIGSLPESYPPHWIIAQDGSFFHMSNGKFIVLDADSDDPVARYKGMFNGSFIPQFYQGTASPHMYIAETYHSRGNRGVRTDVLTIYDKANLAPIAEVILPPKRSSNMPTNFNLQLVDDEKLALIYNFTPAQSVSVVDLEKREFGAISTCCIAWLTGRSACCPVLFGRFAGHLQKQRRHLLSRFRFPPCMHPANVGECASQEHQRQLFEVLIAKWAMHSIPGNERIQCVVVILFTPKKVQRGRNLEQVPAESCVIEIDESDNVAVNH